MIKVVRSKKLWVSSQAYIGELFTTWLVILAACVLGMALGFIGYCVLGSLIYLFGGEAWLTQYSDVLGPFCTFTAGPVVALAVLLLLRLNWERWVPKGLVALWDGPALDAFRRKIEGRNISFSFDNSECSREEGLLRAYLQKVAETAELMGKHDPMSEERKSLQRFIDESAREAVELIAKSLRVGAECDAYIKQCGDKVYS